MTIQRPMFPPRPRPTLATVKGEPATQAQRDAITFEPIKLPFPGTNEEWALNHLPMFRLALVILSRTPEELRASTADLVIAGHAPRLLEDLSIVKQKFADMANFMDMALLRSFLILERLGYSPENPPPDRTDDEEEGGDECA